MPPEGGTLVLCLDGADLVHLADARKALQLPCLNAALAHARPLQSTPVPQTPVAWTALLCGAPPAMTGIWGWFSYRAGQAIRLGAGDLPAAALTWELPHVHLAGLPFLPATHPAMPAGGSSDDVGVTLMAGLQGPTKRAGGSRPHVEPDASFAAVSQLWRDHHRWWAASVSAWAARKPDLTFVHCDSIDWFAHRYGPGTPRGRVGWQLAELFLQDLTGCFQPQNLVVVSDHGSVPVRTFVRVHEALYRAGLSSRRPSDGATLADLSREPVFCGSDYGALWVKDSSLIQQARTLLLGLGADSVEQVDAPGAPSLVPQWPDGWLALLPPELDPHGINDLVLDRGPDFDRLRGHNWFGDHAHQGLIGSPDAATAQALEGWRIDELKPVLQRIATR